MRLVFPEVRLTSVRIVWQPPEEPNGVILGKREQQRGLAGGGWRPKAAGFSFALHIRLEATHKQIHG